ncbi:MAG: hypothetical protein SGI97_08815 [candidate division Zixibacteria bacterium]|nr:hypothetical protein [candidate division Zixibacteria bacterium]
MKIIQLALFILIVTAIAVQASSKNNQTDFDLDSNTAFYEGETHNYIIEPPHGFVMNTIESRAEGYSFAFVLNGESYDSASMMIGVHFYRIRGMSFERALTVDTINLRTFFGAETKIQSVDKTPGGNGQLLVTFSIGDTSVDRAQVLIAYFDGKTEMIIFDLLVTPKISRSDALKVFLGAVKNFRTLARKELSKK